MRAPPPGTDEDALVPISALQHFLFCPRQCALIHLEGIWAEDAATAEGRVLHETVDAGHGSARRGVRTERGLTLRSLEHGLAGKADAVEFAGGAPRPVEYKRGAPKTHRADEVQLCAQALCLEEMFGVPIAEGALFYARTRKRMPVAFDADLRALTARTAAVTRAMLAGGTTPPPRAFPGCKRCSLRAHCHPDRLERPPPVRGWLLRQLGGHASED